MWLWHALYGDVYVDEALLYHLRRTDIKHNFSVYFYALYTTSVGSAAHMHALLAQSAFLPQAALVVALSIRQAPMIPLTHSLLLQLCA